MKKVLLTWTETASYEKVVEVADGVSETNLLDMDEADLLALIGLIPHPIEIEHRQLLSVDPVAASAAS